MLPFLKIWTYYCVRSIYKTVDSIPNSEVSPSIINIFLSYKSLKTCKEVVGETWQNILALGAAIGLIIKSFYYIINHF